MTQHRNFEHDRDPARHAPYRESDVNLGKLVLAEAVKYAFAGAIAGVIAWAGISARQEVLETNVTALAARASEDRQNFTTAINNFNSQLGGLTQSIRELAVAQARIEERRRRLEQ